MFGTIMILLGPSLVDKHYSSWILGMERDMIPKDVMEKYEKGEDIFYDTAYGKGYITKKGHELIKKYAINLDEPIEVHNLLLQLCRIPYFEKKNNFKTAQFHGKGSGRIVRKTFMENSLFAID